MNKNRWPLFIPVLVFAGLIAAALIALSHGAGEGGKFALHVDESAPATDIPLFGTQAARFNTQGRLGRPYMVNFFASWCVPCYAEHETLLALSREDHIPIIGIAYKDKAQPVAAFLGKEGDPFVAVANDAAGRTGIDWGITGVPETFLVDVKGVIRFHLAGPLTQDAVEGQLLPLWEKISR